jgi:hypothetical protein
VSLAAHDDECPGCRPAILNVETRTLLPDDSPMMQIVLRVWRALSLHEKQAWHRFTCQNSRTPFDMQLAETFGKHVQEALAKDDK